MLLLILIVVLIIVLFNRKNKNQDADSDAPSLNNAEIAKLNDELMAELAKPEPDLNKLKSLRAEIENLKTATAAVATSTNPATSENSTVSELPATTPTAPATIASGEKPKAPSLTGLTVALYVGSLLVLAGAAGLVFSGAKTTGLALLLIMTIVFYGGGILLRKNQTLKSASYVFVGTGMMMLPFLGLLIYDLAQGSAELIWLVMSLVGVPMYLFATYIMNSKVFSYVAIAGFVSLSCSMASVVGLALVWYFVFVMALGFIMEIINLTPLGQKLGVMQESLRYAGAYLPAATLVASFAAAASLTNLDYVIIFGVTTLHAVMSYICGRDIFKENLLRFLVPSWLVLLVNLIFPEVNVVGAALAFAALAEILLVFFNLAKMQPPVERNRKETEIVWTIISLVVFIIAGVLVGYGSEYSAPWSEYVRPGVPDAVWAWVSAALVVDIVIILLVRYATRQNAWIIGLVAAGIALPMTFLSAIHVSGANQLITYTVVYLIEMVGLEALLWKNRTPVDDGLTAAAVSILGLAAIISGSSQSLNVITFAVISLCLFLRSRLLGDQQMRESSVYTAAAAAYSLIDLIIPTDLKFADTLRIHFAVVAHLALAAFIATSILWEKGSTVRRRLIIGCAILLFTIGCIAMSGALWAMYLFMAESALILLAGIFIKNNIIRIIGAVAVFLAVLWFTKDLSFVWPFVLGLGIIGTVVFILLRNSRKNPMPLPPSK